MYNRLLKYSTEISEHDDTPWTQAMLRSLELTFLGILCIFNIAVPLCKQDTCIFVQMQSQKAQKK